MSLGMIQKSYGRRTTAATVQRRRSSMTALRASGALACAAALVLTGCGSSSGGGGGGSSSSSDILFGGLFDLTGSASVLGSSEVEGAKAAVAAVNKQGGVLGRQIKFDVLDTESDPQAAVQMARQLLSEHAAVIIGPSTSAAGLPVVPILNSAEVPDLNLAGLSTFPQVTDKTYIFDSLPTTPTQTASIFMYWQSIGIKRVALLGTAGASFEELEELFSKSALSKYGLTLVNTTSFPAGTADITASLTTVANSHPQAVFAGAFGADELTIFKQFSSLPELANTPLFGTAGFTSPSVIGSLPASATKNLYSTVWRAVVADSLTGAPKAAAEAYLSGMTAAGYTPDPTSTAIGAWDAVMAAVDAIRKAGSTDGPKIQYQLSHQTYVGASATYARTPSNHQGVTPADTPVARFENGKWVQVFAG